MFSRTQSFFFSVVFVSFLCVALHAQAQSARLHSVDRAISLFNKGNYDFARKLLEENLLSVPEDIDSRLLLGMMSDYLGEKEEAVDIWRAGLSGKEEDYPLYMSIAELRMEQSSALEKHKVLAYQRTAFQKEALAAFLKAQELYPYESEPRERVAEAHEELGQYETALTCWRYLQKSYPRRADYPLAVGRCLLKLKEETAAAEALQIALDIKPSLAEAHSLRAQLAFREGDARAAEDALHRAAFYNWLPHFIEREYNEAAFTLLHQLFNEQLRPAALDDILRGLAGNPTPQNLDVLATFVWYHSFTPQQKRIALRVLSKNGEHGQALLFKMAKHSHNMLLVRDILREILPLRLPGTLTLLVELLPREQENPNTPPGIYEAMASLSDTRAIPYLASVLQGEKKQRVMTADAELWVFNDGENQRARAAFALGSFPFGEPERILKKELASSETSRVYAAAALFRRTKEKKYLQLIDSWSETHAKLSPVLWEFLASCEDKRAKRLAQRLQP